MAGVPRGYEKVKEGRYKNQLDQDTYVVIYADNDGADVPLHSMSKGERPDNGYKISVVDAGVRNKKEDADTKKEAIKKAQEVMTEESSIAHSERRGNNAKTGELPDVWRQTSGNLTIVYEDRTVSYDLEEVDKGEDRAPPILNSSWIGADAKQWYSDWREIDVGNRDGEIPAVFVNTMNGEEYAEIIYANRTEVYKEKKVYQKGSNARIFEDMSMKQYRRYYRGNGFKLVNG